MLPEESNAYIENLFIAYLEATFVFVKKNLDYAIYQVCVQCDKDNFEVTN